MMNVTQVQNPADKNRAKRAKLVKGKLRRGVFKTSTPIPSIPIKYAPTTSTRKRRIIQLKTEDAFGHILKRNKKIMEMLKRG